METICIPVTVRHKRPQSKVIRLEDYRSCAPETWEREQASPVKGQRAASHKSLRYRLETVCLALEAMVCLALLFLTLSAGLRFFFPF
jgi:hypothetical protein